MEDKEYFYWRNSQGIPERHHVSEVDRILLGGTGEKQTTTSENTRESVRESGGEDTTQATDQSIREVEDCVAKDAPISTIIYTASENERPSRSIQRHGEAKTCVEI